MNIDPGFKDYLIIVGFPRSGTTMLRSYLSYYPELCVHEIEPHWIQDFYLKHGKIAVDGNVIRKFLLNHRKFPSHNKWTQINIPEESLKILFPDNVSFTLREMVNLVFNYLFRDQEHHKKTLVLKHPGLIFSSDTPELLDFLFAPKKTNVILLVRDPKAAIASYVSRWRNKGMKNLTNSWKKAYDYGQMYYSSNNILLATLKYEDFLAHPFEEIKRFSETFGIDLEPREFVLKRKVREWDRATKERKFVTIEGLDESKKDKWKAGLKPAEVWLIEKYCGDYMKNLDYEFSRPEISRADQILSTAKDNLIFLFFSAKSFLRNMIN